MQNHILEPSKLLDENGNLLQRGYATKQLLEYDRAQIKAKSFRIKEWDYYLMYNDSYAVALTIADNGYMGLVSASFLDFKGRKEKTQSKMIAFPMGRLHLPSSSKEGNISYKDKDVNVSFQKLHKSRVLKFYMKNFNEGDLSVQITLTDEPKDSMVIATPFEKKHAFYYNQKIIGMRASGTATYRGHTYLFQPNNSFGLLDWGRGVWTYKNTWYWSAAQGIIANRLFGLNLGYGFGDTSAASENMIFVDGVAQKLGEVVFEIPTDERGLYEYLKPWHFQSTEGRLDLTFEPILNRSFFSSAVFIKSNQNQVFGTFNGTVMLEDGSNVYLDHFLGFAEHVSNRW